MTLAQRLGARRRERGAQLVARASARARAARAPRARARRRRAAARAPRAAAATSATRARGRPRRRPPRPRRARRPHRRRGRELGLGLGLGRLDRRRGGARPAASAQATRAASAARARELRRSRRPRRSARLAAAASAHRSLRCACDTNASVPSAGRGPRASSGAAARLQATRPRVCALVRLFTSCTHRVFRVEVVAVAQEDQARLDLAHLARVAPMGCVAVSGRRSIFGKSAARCAVGPPYRRTKCVMLGVVADPRTRSCSGMVWTGSSIATSNCRGSCAALSRSCRCSSRPARSSCLGAHSARSCNVSSGIG